MKKLLTLLSAIMLFSACSNKTENTAENTETTEVKEPTGSFGDKIDTEGAIPVDELIAQMGSQTEMPAKIEGTITECCQKKGCWMNIDKGDGTTMKVTFRDYGFFVPMDAGGRTAVMQGRAYVDTLSVETLRHYAEDAGRSEEEIAKITEPEVSLAFEADGVVIR